MYIAVDQRLAICELLSSDYSTYKLAPTTRLPLSDWVQFDYVIARLYGIVLLLQGFRSGADVISGGWQILRYVTLLTTVSGAVTLSTSQATYLQYLNGTQLPYYLSR